MNNKNESWRRDFLESQIDSTIYRLLGVARTNNWEISLDSVAENYSVERKKLYQQALERMVRWHWLKPSSGDNYVVTDLGKAVDFEAEAERLMNSLLYTASRSGWKLKSSYVETVAQLCPGRYKSEVYVRSFQMLLEKGFMVSIGDDTYQVTETGKEEHRHYKGL